MERNILYLVSGKKKRKNPSGVGVSHPKKLPNFTQKLHVELPAWGSGPGLTAPTIDSVYRMTRKCTFLHLTAVKLINFSLNGNCWNPFQDLYLLLFLSCFEPLIVKFVSL